MAKTLAVPMAYLHDLVLIVPAAGWRWVDLRTHGATRWAYALLLAPLGAVLVVKAVAATFGIQIGAVLVSVMLGLALQRYRGALGSSPSLLVRE